MDIYCNIFTQVHQVLHASQVLQYPHGIFHKVFFSLLIQIAANYFVPINSPGLRGEEVGGQAFVCVNQGRPDLETFRTLYLDLDFKFSITASTFTIRTPDPCT